jgi:hypothetical protein
MKMQNKPWMATPTSPSVLHVPTHFQLQPRDPRWLPLVGLPSLLRSLKRKSIILPLPSRIMPFDTEDFDYPPTGSKFKQVVVGIIIPGFIVYYGVNVWIDEEAYLPGRGGGVTIHGESARAMAVLYMSVASFVHSRWFWGMVHADKIYLVGMVGSLFIFLGSLIWALSVT